MDRKLRLIFELFLIFLGLLTLLLMADYGISGDGLVRFDALSQLLEEGKIPNIKQSMAGPFFSIPLWFLGEIIQSHEWWLARYNFFIFLCGLLAFYVILRGKIDGRTQNAFFIILIFSSMFPNHLINYYGEVFTAMFVAVGILAIRFGHQRVGWASAIIGVANTPATFIGLTLVVTKYAWDTKRWRYCFVILIAAGLILLESYIFRGSILTTGYEGDHGFRTLMPYSGRPGFSYPFFFGLISILFFPLEKEFSFSRLGYYC